MREPGFWSRPAGLTALALSPIAAIYGAIASWRMAQPGRAAGVPVICVGNLTVGGAGKTPTAIAIAELLQAAGRRPFVLSRGYGGALAGPVRVDAARHRAADVGDEPLLIARTVPTIVSRNRAAGAEAARAAGADVIVMDDGLQNPSLDKDLAIVVVDGRRGIGNGRVFPAGPLRAPLEAQWGCADAVLIVGAGEAGRAVANDAQVHGLPVLHGRLEPDQAALASLQGRKVLAFAGIGDPEKFFATLQAAGVEVAARVSFPDHHSYSASEAADLVRRADRDGLLLATTEKDLARLNGRDDLAALRSVARALPVRLVVDEEQAWRSLVLVPPI